MPGAKIVKAHGHARGSQLRQTLNRQGLIRHRGAFGDLDLELAAVHPVLVKEPTNVADEVRLLKLPTGQIDAHSQAASPEPVAAPRRQLPTGFTQHRPTDGHDEIGVFRQRHEFLRLEEAPFRMRPTEQCFEADDRLAVEPEDRLTVEAEFSALERGAQLDLDLVANQYAVPQVSLKD